MADPGHDSEKRERNHLGKSRQPAFILTAEVCCDQQEKANLKTAPINYRQQARNDRARQFVGVREISSAQYAKEIRRDRGAKENRRAQPEPEQQGRSGFNIASKIFIGVRLS